MKYYEYGESYLYQIEYRRQVIFQIRFHSKESSMVYHNKLSKDLRVSYQAGLFNVFGNYKYQICRSDIFEDLSIGEYSMLNVYPLVQIGSWFSNHDKTRWWLHEYGQLRCYMEVEKDCESVREMFEWCRSRYLTGIYHYKTLDDFDRMIYIPGSYIPAFVESKYCGCGYFSKTQKIHKAHVASCYYYAISDLLCLSDSDRTMLDNYLCDLDLHHRYYDLLFYLLELPSP